MGKLVATCWACVSAWKGVECGTVYSLKPEWMLTTPKVKFS